MAKAKQQKGMVSHDGFGHITVDTQSAFDAMLASAKAGLTTMLWGSPGVGKTSLWRKLGDKMGRPVTIFNPSQLDMIDVKYPYIDVEEYKDGKTTKKRKVSRYAVSDMIPQFGDHIVVVDEINTCLPSSAPMWYSLTLEKRVGTHLLPEGCIVGATGNRVFDRSAAQPMQLAQKDRMLHLNVRPSSDAFCDWAAENGLLPEVMSYVRDMPTCLEAVNFDDPAGGCTPRSLHKLSDQLKSGIPSSVEPQMIKGIIGEACGIEFDAYLQIFRNKISIDKILKDPKSQKIPENRPDIKTCIATGLAARANKDNIKKIIDYCNDNMEKTYLIICMKDVIARNKNLVTSKEFVKFANENLDYLQSK